MAIATRFDTILSPTWTQQTLYDAIKTACANTGLSSSFDEYTSGTDKIVVYAIVTDNTKTYGTTYLRIRVTTTFVVAIQIYSTWTIATHIGTGGSAEISNTALVATTSVNFIALNGGSEHNTVLIYQGSIYFPIMVLIPANKPSWWNLASFNYCFIPTTNTFTVWRCTTINPYANTEFDCNLNNIRMASANSISNRRDLLQGFILFTQSNTGIGGRTSDDLVSVAASGTTKFDTLQIPGSASQYLLLNPASGGLAIRTA